MATVQLHGPELLKAVQQLAPREFDAFLETALALRSRPTTGRFSAKESCLIQRSNRGIPEKVCRRHEELTCKRKRRLLTDDEHAELLRLTDRIERQDAERACRLARTRKSAPSPNSITDEANGYRGGARPWLGCPKQYATSSCALPLRVLPESCRIRPPEFFHRARPASKPTG